MTGTEPRPPGHPAGPAPAARGRPGGPLFAAWLAVQEPGPRATLVQISSTFCRPCHATRRILSDVAAMVEGVVHLDIDAGSRPDLAAELEIARTPTVLVLDAAGRLVRRAAGQPRRADVIAVLGTALGVV